MDGAPVLSVRGRFAVWGGAPHRADIVLGPGLGAVSVAVGFLARGHPEAGSAASVASVVSALIVLAFVGAGLPAGPASLLPFAGPPPPSDAEVLAKWIRDLQYSDPAASSSFGAIRIHHTPGHWYGQTPYYRVVPYTSSLAVYSYLHSGSDGGLDLAERWFDWYVRHMDLSRTPPGVVLDTWYLSDGSGETVCPPGISPNYCPYEDASDSYAGTFLFAVGEYAKRDPTRAAAFLSTPERRAGIERAARVILFLQDPLDGLTWARDDYHAKYTMDNSESYAGLRAAATLESNVFGNATLAGHYADRAEAMRLGIEGQLYNAATGFYRLAKHENGAFDEANLLAWYPGTAPIVWPQLFGVHEAQSARAQAQMRALNEGWDGLPMPDWTNNQVDPTGQLWTSVGNAALKAGHVEEARDHAAFVKCRKFPAGNQPDAFAWPWTADDAARLLSSLANGVGTTVNAKAFCP